MKKLILALLLASFIIPSVSADMMEPTYMNCTDGLLIKEFNMYLNNKAINMSESKICELGCASNGIECNGPHNMSGEYYIAIGLTLAIIAFIFAYQAKNTKIQAYQLLFFIGSALTIVADFGLMLGATIMTQNQVIGALTSLYQMSVLIFIAIIGFGLLFYLRDTLTFFLNIGDNMGARTKRQKKKRK